jgi:hypothetical protein
MEGQPALWLKGIPNLSPPPCPLTLEYKAGHAGQDGCFVDFEMDEFPVNVEGMTLGGDGSGGEHSSDPRLRRCGFGLVAIEGSQGIVPAHMWYGSTPGEQNTYIAEATALLHALRFTDGDCTMAIDNAAVVKQAKKSPKSDLKHNGLLWQAIFLAKQARTLRGGGTISLVWLGSHRSLESSLQNGASAMHWAANQIADSLAGRGASEASLPMHDIDSLRCQHKLAHKVLRRLAAIAVAIVPAAKSRPHHQHVSRHKGKLELVSQWAKGAGHSLTASSQCVKGGSRMLP